MIPNKLAAREAKRLNKQDDKRPLMRPRDPYEILNKLIPAKSKKESNNERKRR